MSEKNYFTIIAYDIADDKRRRSLVRVLESFGERAQESVFEAWLTERERNKMETKSHRCIDTAADRLAIYVLPKADRECIVNLGQGSIAQDFSHLVVG